MPQVLLKDILDNPFQPRTQFEDASVQSLATEIQAEGFWKTTFQGRRTKTGKVELVFGHRRIRALRLLNVESVAVDYVDLTDAQMATRSLIENFQREGLTDLEKADGVKRAVDLLRVERAAVHKPERGAMQELAYLFGVTRQRISELYTISSTMVDKDRTLIQSGQLTGKTALAAKEWGGEAYLKTLAAQSQESTKTGKLLKPTHITVDAMKRAVNEAPAAVQAKLKAAIVKGDVVTPVDAAMKGRRLAAERLKREKPEVQELGFQVVGWTHDLRDLRDRLQTITPYMVYLEDVPPIFTDPFRAAFAEFFASAQALREALAVPDLKPRSIGRGQTPGATPKRALTE